MMRLESLCALGLMVTLVVGVFPPAYSQTRQYVSYHLTVAKNVNLTQVDYDWAGIKVSTMGYLIRENTGGTSDCPELYTWVNVAKMGPFFTHAVGTDNGAPDSNRAYSHQPTLSH